MSARETAPRESPALGARGPFDAPPWVNAADVRAWLETAAKRGEHMATLPKYRLRPGNLRDSLLASMASSPVDAPRLSAADDVRLQSMLLARFGQPFGVADVAPMLRQLAAEVA